MIHEWKVGTMIHEWKQNLLQDICNEEEEVHFQPPHFLSGSLKMSERNIKEALNTLHGTHSLMKYLCWKLEEKYSMEDMEKFLKFMKSTKGNFLQLLYDRDSLLDLVEFLHESSLKDEEYNYNLTQELLITQDS